jgi:hypothetical protein
MMAGTEFLVIYRRIYNLMVIDAHPLRAGQVGENFSINMTNHR